MGVDGDMYDDIGGPSQRARMDGSDGPKLGSRTIRTSGEKKKKKLLHPSTPTGSPRVSYRVCLEKSESIRLSPFPQYCNQMNSSKFCSRSALLVY